MNSPELQSVANNVLRRAERQGFVIPREVRGELTAVGLAEGQWKEVIELLRECLNYRQGRYYFLSPSRPKLEAQQVRQRTVREAVGEFLERYKSRQHVEERRQEERVHFIHPVRVRLEDGEGFTVLSRDLSPSGVRLVSHRSLLGRKLSLDLPTFHEGDQPLTLVVRILWTTMVADGLFENGGTFLELHAG